MSKYRVTAENSTIMLMDEYGERVEAWFTTVNDLADANNEINKSLLAFCIGGSVCHRHPEYAQDVIDWINSGKVGDMPTLKEGE